MSAKLVNKWRKEIAEEEKEKYVKMLQNIVCLTIDGKICLVAIGHGKHKRWHILTFVAEPPFKYIAHMPCGETGKAMSVANLTVITETNSLTSLTTMGAGM